jgi:hypothetical protein
MIAAHGKMKRRVEARNNATAVGALAFWKNSIRGLAEDVK